MQEFGDNTIRRIDWQNVFPVVLLPRAYKFALGFRVILLAFVGLAVTSFLASYLYIVPLGSDCYLYMESPPIRQGVSQVDGNIDIPPGFVSGMTNLVFPKYSSVTCTETPVLWSDNRITFSKLNSSPEIIVQVPRRISSPWVQLTTTGHEMFSSSTPLSFIWFAVVLIIWACIGGMITRIVALRFAQDRRENFTQLFGFTRKKWLSYMGAMILPMFAIFFALLPVWLFGWIWQTFFASQWFVDFAHLILAFPFALVTVLISLGFMLGWPLMFAAISTEGSDAFDAISRGFSYVYQRPIQFVFYHLCNLVIYVIGLGIAYFVFYQTATLIGCAPSGLMILFNSFAFAYFWSSSTVIYFLLRRSCDATPLDQVYLGDANKRTLPPFGAGQHGEPELRATQTELSHVVNRGAKTEGVL